MSTDADLIQTCNAVMQADAAFRAACEAGDDAKADALSIRRADLLQPVPTTGAATQEGVRAKAGVVAALYDWPAPGDADGRDVMIASLLRDLGAIVPAGFAP